MLTLGKLKTYQRFGGDMDGWARSHGAEDSSGITDADWHLIDELRGALYIAASGKASPEFVAVVERRVEQAATDQDARTLLRELSLRLS